MLSLKLNEQREMANELKRLNAEMSPTTFGQKPLAEKIAAEIKQRAKTLEQNQTVKK